MIKRYLLMVEDDEIVESIHGDGFLIEDIQKKVLPALKQAIDLLEYWECCEDSPGMTCKENIVTLIKDLS